VTDLSALHRRMEQAMHGLVRVGEVVGQQPDWIFFLIGTNDARTQGSHPTKTLLHHEETARNIAELPVPFGVQLLGNHPFLANNRKFFRRSGNRNNRSEKRRGPGAGDHEPGRPANL